MHFLLFVRSFAMSDSKQEKSDRLLWKMYNFDYIIHLQQLRCHYVVINHHRCQVMPHSATSDHWNEILYRVHLFDSCKYTEHQVSQMLDTTILATRFHVCITNNHPHILEVVYYLYCQCMYECDMVNFSSC